MNNLYQQLSQQSQVNNPTMDLVRMMKSSGNPQQLIESMAKTNPRVQQIMNLLQTSGQSPKDLFYTMARQKGVDPNQILGMLR